MFFQDDFVISCAARVIWDGITRPEPLEGGGQKYTMKVAIIASAPEVGELEAIATKALQEDSKFNGQLPPGGVWPLMDVQPGQFGDLITGHKTFNCSTYQVPDVFDVNGNKLDPMQYSSMFYPGSTVQVIVRAKTFNNVSKGVKFELHGIKVVDTTSPKLPVANSVDAAAAFGGTPVPMGAPAGNMPPTATPAPGATPQMPSAVPSAPAPTAAPAAPSAVPAASPSPAYDFLTVNGQQFTPDQLRQAGWTEEQIAAAR